MAIFKYPLDPPATGNIAADNPTESIDYLMIRRKRIRFDDSNGSNYYGLNVPNNSVKFNVNGDKVYIAMPQNIQTAYQPSYRQLNSGVGGKFLMESLKSDSYGELADALQKAAEGTLPEFTAATFAQAAQGASQLLGLAGQIDANSILELTQGRIFNPYTEQLFNNMQFRQHNFTFKMFARDQKESKEIQNIIRYLKEGAVPRYGSTGENNERFFETPDKYDLKFIRVSADGKQTARNIHFKMHTSVCSGISVNYTPDGQYNAIKPLPGDPNFDGADGSVEGSPLQVPAVVVNCAFTETQFVTQRNIIEGF